MHENHDAILRQAEGFAASRHYAEALRLCDLLLRDGERADVLRLKGIVLSRALQPEKAVELLRRSCALAPDEPAGFLALAEALREAGRLSAADRLPEALEAADEAVRLKPDAFESRNLRGWLKLQLGDEKGAMLDLEAAFHLMPAGPRKEEVRARLREWREKPGKP